MRGKYLMNIRAGTPPPLRFESRCLVSLLTTKRYDTPIRLISFNALLFALAAVAYRTSLGIDKASFISN
jgi:hypothetical protein